MDIAASLQELGLLAYKHIGTLIQILVIIVLALISIRLLNRAKEKIEQKIIDQRVDPAQQARLTTLLRAGTSILWFLIIAIAGMIILTTIGVNLAPLLASIGVASLALSLGAQTVIKDFIGGILILVENQFNMGDEIQVGAVTGTVEKVTLRTTYVRDNSGKLFMIPNGDIRTVSNNSLNWSKAIVDLNLQFDADMARAMEALQTAIGQAASDEALTALLLEPPQVTGWNNQNEWAVQVRLSAKTHPGKQADAAAILRKYALPALQSAGITLAQP